MKANALVLSLLLLGGCTEQYRYPCQDPANWKKEECNRPACEGSGMCWDTLSGVKPDGQLPLEVDKIPKDEYTETIGE